MKTFYLHLLVALTVSLSYSLTAQNLVPNGDFESYSALPNSSSDWSFCIGWSNVNGNSGFWPYATPDYFHTSGTGGGSLPNSAFGDVNPQQGSAIMGFYCRHGSQLNSRDYIATTLTSPLVVGTTYTISFWLTSGYGDYYYGSSSSHFGVQLTMSPMSQTQHENIGGIPQAEVTTDPWLTSWTFYSFTYVATSAYQYVTVGNFYDDAATVTTLHDASANFPPGSYYFMDDLIIEAGPLLPIELVYFAAKNDGSAVLTEWETSTEIDNDYFTIERSQDAKNWTELGRVNGAGNSIETLNYSYVDNSPLSGVSYYRLMQTDFHGDISYSSVKSVYRDQSELVLYPNPTNGIVTISGSNGDVTSFRLFSLLGQDLTDQIRINGTGKPGEIVLDLTSVPCGVYILQTTNGLKKITKM